MALSGVRVVELEGIGPAPLAGCILADFGADVISVCRSDGSSARSQGDPVARGKRSIAVDLKSNEGVALIRRMAARADVFIEPFRPGVAEKLGLGPGDLCKANTRLIYGRMTGFGQGGTRFSGMAGHDANYLALSGALDFFRRGDERPFPPANFAGDYAGGGLVLALGIALALVERAKSGRGQVIDAAMVDGANYVALPLYKWAQSGFVPLRSDGHMDAAKFLLAQAPHFGETYLCKEDPAKLPGTREYVSVQALEPQFYKALLKGLGLDSSKLPSQYDQASWSKMKERFAEVFLTRTRDEWAEIFFGTDACCVPVLSGKEAAVHPHSVARGSFAPTPEQEGLFEPAPAPKLSRTPGHLPRPRPAPGAHTAEVLMEFGFSEGEVSKLLATGAAAAAPVAAPSTSPPEGPTTSAGGSARRSKL